MCVQRLCHRITLRLQSQRQIEQPLPRSTRGSARNSIDITPQQHTLRARRASLSRRASWRLNHRKQRELKRREDVFTPRSLVHYLVYNVLSSPQ